jgi:hypothetical protein
VPVFQTAGYDHLLYARRLHKEAICNQRDQQSGAGVLANYFLEPSVCQGKQTSQASSEAVDPGTSAWLLVQLVHKFELTDALLGLVSPSKKLTIPVVIDDSHAGYAMIRAA